MSVRAKPLGGPLVTPITVALAFVAALGVGIIGWRFWAGLGATTALSDGYPWGIWIAYDVVTGTALSCGGYSIAILVYILNRGRYHPLVRPAVLTSALGYTLAGLSVVIDVGRPWNAWRLVWPGNWQTSSVLLEVALCIMTYTLVSWVEVSPAFLERLAESRRPWLRELAGRVGRGLDRALPWIIALGVLLPSMHQSSLGSLLLVARTKVHALWHTPLLPLLFLLSVVAMGFAAVVLESVLSSLVYRRPRESAMLASLGRVVSALLALWVVVRLVDLGVRGRLPLVLAFDRPALFFLGELALVGTGVVLLAPARWRARGSYQLGAAMAFLLAGGLYRFDAFLVAFDPGAGWRYFPSSPELLVTFGIIAIELLAYITLIKVLPILPAAPARGET